MSNVVDESVKVGIQGSFSTLASTFFYSSLAHMIPWILVMTAIVVCDLVAALRRCYIAKETIKFSRTVRDTMAKLVTYYSFVISVTMINVAAGGEYELDKWLCLIICGVEISSVLSNILKPMGYSIDFTALISLVSKTFSKTDVLNDIVKKEDDER